MTHQPYIGQDTGKCGLKDTNGSRRTTYTVRPPSCRMECDHKLMAGGSALRYLEANHAAEDMGRISCWYHILGSHENLEDPGEVYWSLGTTLKGSLEVYVVADVVSSLIIHALDRSPRSSGFAGKHRWAKEGVASVGKRNRIPLVMMHVKAIVRLLPLHLSFLVNVSSDDGRYTQSSPGPRRDASLLDLSPGTRFTFRRTRSSFDARRLSRPHVCSRTKPFPPHWRIAAWFLLNPSVLRLKGPQMPVS